MWIYTKWDLMYVTIKAAVISYYIDLGLLCKCKFVHVSVQYEILV